MASKESNAKANNDYINQLIKEQEGVKPFSHAYKLLQQEIERVRFADPAEEVQRKDSHIVVHTGKQFRLRVKIHIPIDEHPQFNFVGKLLGPKGSSLQQLQEATQTRMAILGKGSMRDKRKEEEFRKQGDPKYAHLNEDLHVEVTAYAPAPEAYRRMAAAIAEIQRFLVPDPYMDDMRPPPQYMNDGNKMPPNAPHMAPRGGPPMMGPPVRERPMGPPMGREPPMARDQAPPRRPMVQSSYPAQESDDWSSPRQAPPPQQRRGGFHGKPAASPSGRPNMSYEEPANNFNDYGDNYGEYDSRDSAPYYDSYAEPEPAYNDGYADGGPMRSLGGGRGGGAGGGGARNNSRMQTHPYAGATRRPY